MADDRLMRSVPIRSARCIQVFILSCLLVNIIERINQPNTRNLLNILLVEAGSKSSKASSKTTVIAIDGGGGGKAHPVPVPWPVVHCHHHHHHMKYIPKPILVHHWVKKYKTHEIASSDEHPHIAPKDYDHEASHHDHHHQFNEHYDDFSLAAATAGTGSISVLPGSDLHAQINKLNPFFEDRHNHLYHSHQINKIDNVPLPLDLIDGAHPASMSSNIDHGTNSRPMVSGHHYMGQSVGINDRNSNGIGFGSNRLPPPHMPIKPPSMMQSTRPPTHLIPSGLNKVDQEFKKFAQQQSSTTRQMNGSKKNSQTANRLDWMMQQASTNNAAGESMSSSQKLIMSPSLNSESSSKNVASIANSNGTATGNGKSNNETSSSKSKKREGFVHFNDAFDQLKEESHRSSTIPQITTAGTGALMNKQDTGGGVDFNQVNVKEERNAKSAYERFSEEQSSRLAAMNMVNHYQLQPFVDMNNNHNHNNIALIPAMQPPPVMLANSIQQQLPTGVALINPLLGNSTQKQSNVVMPLHPRPVQNRLNQSPEPLFGVGGFINSPFTDPISRGKLANVLSESRAIEMMTRLAERMAQLEAKKLIDRRQQQLRPANMTNSVQPGKQNKNNNNNSNNKKLVQDLTNQTLARSLLRVPTRFMNLFSSSFTAMRDQPDTRRVSPSGLQFVNYYPMANLQMAQQQGSMARWPSAPPTVPVVNFYRAVAPTLTSTGSSNTVHHQTNLMTRPPVMNLTASAGFFNNSPVGSARPNDQSVSAEASSIVTNVVEPPKQVATSKTNASSKQAANDSNSDSKLDDSPAAASKYIPNQTTLQATQVLPTIQITPTTQATADLVTTVPTLMLANNNNNSTNNNQNLQGNDRQRLYTKDIRQQKLTDSTHELMSTDQELKFYSGQQEHLFQQQKMSTGGIDGLLPSTVPIGAKLWVDSNSRLNGPTNLPLSPYTLSSQYSRPNNAQQLPLYRSVKSPQLQQHVMMQSSDANRFQASEFEPSIALADPPNAKDPSMMDAPMQQTVAENSDAGSYNQQQTSSQDQLLQMPTYLEFPLSPQQWSTEALNSVNDQGSGSGNGNGNGNSVDNNNLINASSQTTDQSHGSAAEDSSDNTNGTRTGMEQVMSEEVADQNAIKNHQYVMNLPTSMAGSAADNDKLEHLSSQTIAPFVYGTSTDAVPALSMISSGYNPSPNHMQQAQISYHSIPTTSQESAGTGSQYDAPAIPMSSYLSAQSYAPPTLPSVIYPSSEYNLANTGPIMLTAKSAKKLSKSAAGGIGLSSLNQGLPLAGNPNGQMANGNYQSFSQGGNLTGGMSLLGNGMQNLQQRLPQMPQVPNIPQPPNVPSMPNLPMPPPGMMQMAGLALLARATSRNNRFRNSQVNAAANNGGTTAGQRLLSSASRVTNRFMRTRRRPTSQPTAGAMAPSNKRPMFRIIRTVMDMSRRPNMSPAAAATSSSSILKNAQRISKVATTATAATATATVSHDKLKPKIDEDINTIRSARSISDQLLLNEAAFRFPDSVNNHGFQTR